MTKENPLKPLIDLANEEPGSPAGAAAAAILLALACAFEPNAKKSAKLAADAVACSIAAESGLKKEGRS